MLTAAPSAAASAQGSESARIGIDAPVAVAAGEPHELHALVARGIAAQVMKHQRAGRAAVLAAIADPCNPRALQALALGVLGGVAVS